MNSTYVRTKLSNIINVTEIVTIHYYEFDNTFEFVGEKHNFWEIVYVDSGSVEIVRDGETVVLKQGEIIFHRPNEFHTIKSYNSSPNVFVISFVCKSSAMSCFGKFKSILDKSLKPFISSIINEAEETFVIPKNDTSLKKLIKKDESEIGGEQLIKTYLEQFLIILMREISGKNKITIFPSRESMETHLATEIKEFLKEKVRERLKMEEVCFKFGYSKTYISRLFKEQCSVSLMTYYNLQKIEYAKKLIRERQYSVTQISNLLSFDSPQYFARVFKRVTQMTPSEFANSLEIRVRKS